MARLPAVDPGSEARASTLRFGTVRLATGPRVHYAEQGETGHCPNWERPEQVAADLETFIQDT